MHGSDLVSLRCRSRQGDRAMHTPTIVTQVMQCCLSLMHAARWRALHDVVVSSVNGHALSLVALAVGTPDRKSVV